MIFKTHGNPQFPSILMLHGGGLSDWSLTPLVHALLPSYHVITAIIDGHGEAADTPFQSIEICAASIVSYVDVHHHGQIHAITGLSIGAQVVCEVLSQAPHIAQYALIESALVCPIKTLTALTATMYPYCYGLIQKRWFAKFQAKALCVPDSLFEKYYQDSLRMSKASLVQLTISNGHYDLNPSFSQTTAKVLILVGEKEIGIMKKSAKRLHAALQGSRLFVAPRMKHGELSLVHTEVYLEQLNGFLAR